MKLSTHTGSQQAGTRIAGSQEIKQPMKALRSMRWLLLFLLMGATAANAQISVSGGTGLAATYTSFTNAGGLFAAINATAQTGNNIVVTVTADITTEAGTTALNAGAWATINITPTGGAARTVSGTVAGAPLINLNGADNVTINGLNAGGNSLTISNLSTAATSGTSTIKFIGGATGNTITNCSILGSSTMAVGTNGGNFWFSTDANTTAGNDNNTISNCNIGPAGGNLPSKGIYGNGSTTTTAIGNSGNTINNNNFIDIFAPAVAGASIYTAGGCNGWSITNNRFYQTATRTWTTGANHMAIDLNNATATSGAQGFTITGNIIGYASNTQTGTYTLTGAGASAKFVGIHLNAITGGTVSDINNNTVAAVSMTAVTSSGTTSSSPFQAIYVENGLANTNNNTIGSQSATGSLTFSTTTTSSTDVYGIHNFSTDNWVTNSNNIGGISVTNAGASGTFLLYAMRANTSTSKTWTATSNLVGGTIANSIQLNATGTASQVVGMFTSNAGATLTSNTVRNLATNIGTGTTSGASVIGINLTSSTLNNTVAQNTIFNLSNSNTSAASVVTGLQFTGSTAGSVTRNNIYGLTVATNSATAEVNGIRIGGGTTTFANNMIAVGAGIANAVIVSGINEPSATGTDNFYHNSVYIGGSPSAGSGNSFAFNSLVTTSTRSFRNNIFFNARNNSGTASGKNYAVQVGGTAANPAGLTINYNVYNVSGAGGVFGRFNALDVANLGAWKLAVGQDVNSIAADPAFADPTNVTTPDLHIGLAATPVEASGTLIATVTDDFDGQTRSGLTPTDIGADAGNFTAAPSMTYVSSTAVQLTGNGCAGASNVQVLRMEVVTTGALNPLTLTNLTINGNGTSTLGDIATYRIYYTGTSSVFSSSNPIIAATAGLTGSNTVVTPSGTVTLASGTNYFWLVYNLNTSIAGPSLDAEFTNVALSTGGGAPTVTAPAGVVNIFNNPTASASSNTPVCIGNTLNLTGTTDIGTSFTWTGPNTFSSALQSPSITGVTAAAAGTYNFTATANGCSSSVATTIVATPATPVAPTTTGYSMCLNGSIPANQGLTTTTVGAGVITGSQTINFNVAAQPTETNAAPGNTVASASMSALPSGATVTSITLSYPGITALSASWQADVRLGLSGSIVNAAAAGTGAANAAGLFNYTLTSNSGYTVTPAGGTVNLLYWDATSDNAGAEATFPTGTAVATLTVNYSYPDPASVKWYNQLTGGTLIGTGTPFNPIGVDPALPNSGTSGTYTYYAEISNGSCASTRTAASLQIGAALSATAGATPNTPVCAGTSVTLNGAAVGGTAAFGYSWKVGATEVSTAASFSVSPSTTTQYDLTVTDACLQTATASVTVTINPLPAVAVVSGAGTFCGSTTITAANGNDGTMYFQGTTSNGTSTATASASQVVSASGTYYFRAQSAAGCWGPQGSAVVVINPLPTTPTVTPTAANSFCIGGSQALTASGSVMSGTQTILSENFNGVTAGTNTSGTLPSGWTGASLTSGVRLWGVVASAQTGSTIGGGNFLYCESDAYSSFQTRAEVITPAFSAVGYTSINIKFKQYYNDLTSGASTDSARVYVSNNGGSSWTLVQAYDADQGTAFTGAGAVSATLPVGIALTSNMKVRLVYNSDAGGNDWYWAVDDFVIDGTLTPTYAWTATPSLGAGLPAGAGTPSLANASISATPTVAGTYTYSAVAVNPVTGCQTAAVNTGLITVNGLSTISLSSVAGTDAQTVCTNTAIAPITYAVGGAATSASITSGSLPAGVTGSYNAGVFTISGTPTAAGNFSYVITTSGSSCTEVIASGSITVNPTSTITLTTGAPSAAQTVCSNTAINPISYAVAGGATGASITSGSLPAGVNGVFSAGVFTISGTPTAAGSFSYTITTSGGSCGNATASGTITVNDASTITLTSAAGTNNQTVCNNATIAPITYAIAGGGTGASITSGSLPPGVTGSYSAGVFTISGAATASGSYLYTITTSGGSCGQSTASGAITVNGSLAATFTKTNLSACSFTNDGSITVSPTGGSGSYTYSWTGATGSGNPAPQNFTAGNVNPLTGLNYGYYNVTITDNGGCGSITIPNIHVEFAYNVYITNSGTNANACGGSTGSIILYGNGGVQPYTYKLDAAPYLSYQPGNTFTGLPAGTYLATVKDAAGCIQTKSITVGAAAAIVVSPFVRNASSCAPDGSIEVYRSGGTPPYTYSKDGTNYQPGNVFSALAAGSYTVYVKDAAGCVGSAPATVAAGVGLAATTSKVNTSTCINDGSIQVNATGGTAPYTYSKDNGTSYQPSNSFSALGAGNYPIKVKDSKGCTSGTVNVTINLNTIVVTASAVNASSCASSNGSIQLFRTGGVGPYTYSLEDAVTNATFGPATSPVFSGLPAGTYNGYVQDSKGCTAALNSIVVGPSCPAPPVVTNKSLGNNAQVSTAKVPVTNILKVQAYPNPTATAFTLVLEGFSNDKVSITVTDIMGRKVYQAEGNGKQQFRFGSQFIAGIYNVQVVQADKKQSIKLVKE